MRIEHRQHHQVDQKHWDLFIEKAYNGTFYAYSWFLDSVFEDWSVLVDEAFTMALVLTPSSKFGLHYIKHPPPARYLGLFSSEKLTPEMVDRFLGAIPPKHVFSQFYLNKYIRSVFPGWHHYFYPIYELDLIQSSEALRKEYSDMIMEWIEEGENDKWTVRKSQSPNDLVNLWKSEHRRPDIKVEQTCRRILSRGLQSGSCEIISVYSPFNNLAACGVFFYFKKNATLLFYTQGRDRFNELPLSLLLDHYIETHSGRDLTLSLEVLSPGERSRNFHKFPISKGLNTVEVFENFGFQRMQFPVIEKSRSKLLKPLFRSDIFS